MKRSRGSKSKSASGTSKALSSPAKASSSQANVLSSPAKALPNPAKASLNTAKASSSPAKASYSPTKASSNPAEASSKPAKASSSPAKASYSPTKASSNPAEASSKPAKASSSPAKTLSSPARANAGARSRKKPARKGPDETPNNTTDGTIQEKPQDNAMDEAGTANQDESRAGSPDPNCSICLCKMEDKSFTHSCFHMFCFTCLLEWSKIKAECPLCKQSFNSIIHNIRSESDYDVYNLRDAAIVASPPAAISPDDDVHLFPFLFGRTPLRTWTPLLAPLDLQLLADFRSTAHGMLQSFHAEEAFSIFQRMDSRSQIYRDERWAREINLPPGLSYRNVSPEYFTTGAGSELWRRLPAWLDRELAAISRHLVPSQALIRDYVMQLLLCYDVRSGNFYAELEPHFGSQTRLFINHLHNFLRSPLSIRETDRQTVYSDRPPTPPESEIITLDRDDSDIEIMSPVGASAPSGRRPNVVNWGALDPFRHLRPRPMEVAVVADTLRASSPVAGPSGLLGRQQAGVPDEIWNLDHNPTDMHEVSDSESESKPESQCDEIVVVGFDKPWQARSPISLSSDGSDIEVDCADPTTSSASNRSEESEVHLQPSSQERPRVEATKTPDAEGDASSRPWSEFSPDALSEISNGGSFDKSLDCFLRTGNPFVGFDRRFAPERGLEVFEPGGDCRHERHGGCEQCKEKAVVDGNKTKLLPQNSFLLKIRKRNREDCGDSGVVVDVEQFADEPPPKKAAYKKHCRGHKRSANRTDSSLESDGNRACSVEPAQVGSCQTGVKDNSSAREESALLSAANGSSDCVRENRSSLVLKPDSNRESVHGAEANNASSASTCDNNSTDGGRKSNEDSFPRSLRSAPESLGLDASDESSTSDFVAPSDSSESSRICDDLDVSLHSIESIDSDDDSVQWLDSERPAPSGIGQSYQQRNRHISIGSNESYLSSPSVSSVVLQLSDDEEEEEEAGHCVEGVASGDASRHGSQSVDLAGSEAAAPTSPGNSVDIRMKVNGVKHLSEFLENISDDFDSTVNDDEIIGLLELTGNELDATYNLGNDVECLPEGALERELTGDKMLKSGPLQLTGNELNELDNGIKCIPESSSEVALEGELNGENMLKSELVQLSGNELNMTYDLGNDVECLPELTGDNNLESRHVSDKDEEFVNSVKRFPGPSENALECEFGDSGRSILKSGNVSTALPCAVTKVNGIRCFADEAIDSLPLASYVDDDTSEIPMSRTSSPCSGSCAVEDAFDRAIPEGEVSDNEPPKLQSNGPVPLDESC